MSELEWLLPTAKRLLPLRFGVSGSNRRSLPSRLSFRAPADCLNFLATAAPLDATFIRVTNDYLAGKRSHENSYRSAVSYNAESRAQVRNKRTQFLGCSIIRWNSWFPQFSALHAFFRAAHSV